MDKRTLDKLATRGRKKKESIVVSARIPLKVFECLERRGINISETIKNVLGRLAE